MYLGSSSNPVLMRNLFGKPEWFDDEVKKHFSEEDFQKEKDIKFYSQEARVWVTYDYTDGTYHFSTHEP